MRFKNYLEDVLAWEGNDNSTYKELVENFFKGGAKGSTGTETEK